MAFGLQIMPYLVEPVILTNFMNMNTNMIDHFIEFLSKT